MTLTSKMVDARPMILVVEDDDWLRDVVADILEAAGYRVATACNGEEANDYLATASEPPAAIVMDLMMPILSGWEFLDGVKSEARFAATPIVVMSALSRTLPAGADLLLKKPFRVDDLVDTVEHFVKVRRKHSQPRWLA